MMDIIELKINKELVDHKFEGYKLCLDPIPVLKQTVAEGILHRTLQSEDYGFLQTRLSLSHNSLFLDPWCQQSVFYVTEKFNVIWTALEEDGCLAPCRHVWVVPLKKKSDITICFPHSDWALLCDGDSCIHVLHTSSRAAGEPWNLIHTLELENASLIYLLHAAHKTVPSGLQLDLVVASAEPKTILPPQILLSERTSFVCILEWTALVSSHGDQVWNKKFVRRLFGCSYPEYVAVDNVGDTICIAAETEFKCFYDSESEVDLLVPDEDYPAEPYSFTQTLEDITLDFIVSAEKDDVRVTIRPLYLEVVVFGKTLISGDLCHPVDRDGSAWTLGEGRLKVCLSKVDVGLHWPKVIKEDDQLGISSGKVSSEELCQRLTSDREEVEGSVPFNLAQLEECDLEGEHLFLERVSGIERKTLQKVSLSGWLFSCSVRADSLPCFCLRHDVDGILWQPREVLGKDLEVEHCATFPALGYILAGHKTRMFASCDPLQRYAVVSDGGRHLYLYRRPEHLSDSLLLRNRKTGECVSHVAKQHVLSLEHCDQLLGLRAAPHAVYVLSRDTLYVAKLHFDP